LWQCTPFVLSLFALMAKGLSMDANDMACPCEQRPGILKRLFFKSRVRGI
jgi:hypothetical protein